MRLETDEAMLTITSPVREPSRSEASAELANGEALVAAIVDAGFTFVTGVPDSALAEMCTVLDRQHRGQLFLPARARTIVSRWPPVPGWLDTCRSSS